MRIWAPREWTLRAACRDSEPDALFVQGAAQQVAKRVCMGCPVRLDCLADALDNGIDHGVWGGMTDRERRALRRRHPHVRDWWALLNGAVRSGVPAPAENLIRAGQAA